MSVAARLRHWLRTHPTGADALFALFVGVTALLPWALRSSSERLPEQTTLSATVLALACLVLVLRRQAPWAVLAATALLGLVAVGDSSGPTPAYLPACIALCTVATRTTLARAVAAGAVTAMLPLAVVVATDGTRVVDELVFGMTVWAGLATMSGIAVRNQRAVVAAAHERVRVADAGREEEAQRRVAQERLRIARELHDVIAHHVAVISVQAGVAGHLLRDDPDAAAEAVAHVRQASATVLAEVPGLLGLLRTTQDFGDDLLATTPSPRLADVEVLVEQARRSGLGVTWRVSGTPLALSAAGDLTAYRVVQEALTNAARHGRGQAALHVSYDGDACTIEVRNQLAQPGRPQQSGYGLIGMGERVPAVGGEFTVGPEGDDWVVRARLRAVPA